MWDQYRFLINYILYIIALFKITGGWGGIRTHETLSRLPVFKTGPFNHSGTHPFLFSLAYENITVAIS